MFPYPILFPVAASAAAASSAAQQPSAVSASSALPQPFFLFSFAPSPASLPSLLQLNALQQQQLYSYAAALSAVTPPSSVSPATVGTATPATPAAATAAAAVALASASQSQPSTRALTIAWLRGQYTPTDKTELQKLRKFRQRHAQDTDIAAARAVFDAPVVAVAAAAVEKQSMQWEQQQQSVAAARVTDQLPHTTQGAAAAPTQEQKEVVAPTAGAEVTTQEYQPHEQP